MAHWLTFFCNVQVNTDQIPLQSIAVTTNKGRTLQLISLLDLYYSREIDVISLKRQLDYKESLS